MALPLCLRRLPPEACRSPPAWVEWSPEAGSQLANHIPSTPTEAASWLLAIYYASHACSEAFGLWVARQRRLFIEPLDRRLLRPVALYAWHSRENGNLLSRLASEPWSPEQGIKSAVAETGRWLARLKLAVHCGGHPIPDTWLSPGRIAGFDFVALTTWDDIMAERVAMRNCLHTYVDKVASGACRLFSVRSNGTSLATLELAAGKEGVPSIAQLKGPGNSTPAPEVQSAARAWLSSQSGRRAPAEPRRMSREDVTATLQHLLAPYLEATSAPDKGRRSTWSFHALEQQLQHLTACIATPAEAAPRPARNPVPARPIAAPPPLRAAVSERVRAALRLRLGDEVFASWFQALEVEGFDGHTVQVSVPVRFLKCWIEVHYAEDLLACCTRELDGARQVDVEVRRFGAARLAAAEPAAPAAARLPAAGPEGSPLDPRFTFDSFVVGRANRLAHAAAMQVADEPAAAERRFNPLYLHSPVGVGKTHLLNAIAWQARRRNPAVRLLYVTAARFRSQLAAAIAAKAVSSRNDRCRRLDFLIVDDLEYVARDRVAPMLEDILGILLGTGRQVVLASSRPPRDLDGLSERMRTRLQRGLTAEMHPMDAALRLAALRRHVADRRAADPAFDASEPVLALLAERLQTGGHELQGAANRLYLLWQLIREPPTLEIAERIAADMRQSMEPRRVKIDDILRVVTRHFGVSRYHVLSQSRQRSSLRPRQVAMYLAKVLTARPLPEIGRRMGGRDHTAVLHAVRRIERQLAEDPRLREEIADLRRQLAN
jgi:chromosomal replication initiator protein